MLVMKEQVADGQDMDPTTTLPAAATEPLDAADEEEDGSTSLPVGKRKIEKDASDVTDAGDSKKAKGEKKDAKAALNQKAYYCQVEASAFSPEIRATGGREESRIKCAADDVLCAINHIFDHEFDEKDRATSESAMLKTKSLCLSVWCEFLLAGEVSLNGKRIRAYSALRPELQHMCRLAKEKLAIGGRRGGGEQDPLAIARELTKELIEAPVHMLLEGEEDSHGRVSHFITNCSQQAAKIQRFIEDVIDLPVTMHDVHVQTLRGCVGKTLELVDFLSVLQKNVEATIATRWISFATDVSDYYAEHGGFAGGADQVSHQFSVADMYEGDAAGILS